MIIFGTRGVTLTKQRGAFHCPQCGPESAFRHKSVRRFFTLYFLPVIPLDQLGEYVECEACQGTYAPNVLDYDPEGERRAVHALYLEGMRRVMIAMLLADGEIDDEEVRGVCEVFREISGQELEEHEVRAEAAKLRGESASVVEQVRQLCGALNDNGKEMVLRAAHRIAAADGVVSPEELALLQRVGDALELSPAHYRGVLSELGAAQA